ncbi:MAG: hypothetical protein ACR2FN_00080 [Chitinophagaceae bacterium]
MNSIPELIGFFSAIKEDSRIGPVHISLFMAIMQHWTYNDCKNPVYIFSKDLMRLAKISGVATYHKCIRELDEYGYIKYKPTYNHFSKSLIYLQAPVKPID